MRRGLNLLSVDERLIGVLICSRGGEIVNVRLKPILSCASPLVPRARDRSGSPLFISLNGHALLLNGYRVGAGSAGTVVVVQDRGFIWSRRQILIRVAALAGMLAFAVLIFAVYQGARLTRRRADASMIDSLHRAASGEDAVVPDNVAGLLDRLNRDLARVRSERGEPLAPGPARLRRSDQRAHAGHTSWWSSPIASHTAMFAMEIECLSSGRRADWSPAWNRC